MTLKSTQKTLQLTTEITRTGHLHAKWSRGLLLLILFFLYGVARGSDVEVYPYQPVIIPVVYNTNHLSASFSTSVVITGPNQETLTNQITGMHLLGVSGTNSLFMLLNPQTNAFLSPGLYQVDFEGTTKTVEVLQTLDADTNIVKILNNMLLYKILLTLGHESLSDSTKSICQQIVTVSPQGEYSIYAKTYLAIDALYSELAVLYENYEKPNFDVIGNSVLALTAPANHLQWTLLYHKGYAYGMRQNTNNAISTFSALTNGIQHAIWTRNAELHLLELLE